MHFLKKLGVKLKMYPFSQEKGKREPFKRTQTRKGSTEMEILEDKTVNVYSEGNNRYVVVLQAGPVDINLFC